MSVYPSLLERIKAVIIDSFILILLMFAFSIVFSSFEQVPDEARIGAFAFIFFFYDPTFTSLFGGTIGHMIVGLRVRRSNNPEKNINFFFAILRFVCKTALGILSLLTVSSHEEKKAIHDAAANSIVIYA